MGEEKIHVVDASGLLCPMPIVRLSQRIKEIQPGEIIKLIATDPGMKEDVPAWCRSTGHECIEIKEEGGKYIALVKKREE